MSLLLHAGLLTLVVVIGHEKGQIAGEAGEAGTQGGGGGGGGSPGRAQSDVTYYVTIAPLSDAMVDPLALPEVVPIEPLSVDVPPPPLIEVPPAAVPDIALGGGGTGTGEGPGQGSGIGPGSGSGSGGGSGSGTGTGTGAGSGPGSGAGGTIRPPAPTAMIIPPMAPSNLRGRTVRLRLMVDERGRVGSVQLLATSGNGRYDRELRRAAEGWLFHPARDVNGRAIAYPYEYEVEF